MFRGVWTTDHRHLEATIPGVGETLIEVTLDVPDTEIEGYEWVDDEKSYREFLLPADLVNTRATLRIVPASELADTYRQSEKG